MIASRFIARITDDQTAHAAAAQRVGELQQKIWNLTAAAVNTMQEADGGVSAVEALNDMIDITTTRAVALRTHPPLLIYEMLVVLGLISAVLIGYSTAGGQKRIWLHSIGYALVMTGSLYVIVDFEFPRLGFIRIDQFDQLLVDQRKSMG